MVAVKTIRIGEIVASIILGSIWALLLFTIIGIL